MSVDDPQTTARAAAPDGAQIIAAERFRQTMEKGYDADHDDAHFGADLASAAISYAIKGWWQLDSVAGWSPAQVEEVILENWWPFDADEFKPDVDPIRNLAKAGALIAAEIDRLLRHASRDAAGSHGEGD